MARSPGWGWGRRPAWSPGWPAVTCRGREPAAVARPGDRPSSGQRAGRIDRRVRAATASSAGPPSPPRPYDRRCRTSPPRSSSGGGHRPRPTRRPVMPPWRGGAADPAPDRDEDRLPRDAGRRSRPPGRGTGRPGRPGGRRTRSGSCHVGDLVGHAGVDLVADAGDHRHAGSGDRRATRSPSNVARSVRAPPPRTDGDHLDRMGRQGAQAGDDRSLGVGALHPAVDGHHLPGQGRWPSARAGSRPRPRCRRWSPARPRPVGAATGQLAVAGEQPLGLAAPGAAARGRRPAGRACRPGSMADIRSCSRPWGP